MALIITNFNGVITLPSPLTSELCPLEVEAAVPAPLTDPAPLATSPRLSWPTVTPRSASSFRIR